MIKDNVRDYATAAFRFWAAQGKPYDAAQYAAICHAAPEARDVSAVIETFQRAEAYIRQSVEIVYCAEPDKPLRKCDIERRVQAAATELHADERTIYRWLSSARKMFALKRGLRQ